MNSRLLLYLSAATLLNFVLSDLTLAHADQAAFRPVADTSILSDYPTYNFGGYYTFVSGGRPLGGTSRGLLRFDVTPLPADVIITSASLRLTVVDVPDLSVDSIFDLHRLTASWGEGNGKDRGGYPALAGESTWDNRFGTSGSPWATPGGDFLSTTSASTLIDSLGGNYTFDSTPGLVADVQAWLNDPASNYGWLLESESGSIGRTIRRFASRTATFSPLLSIEYTVIPEPGIPSFLILSLAALTWRRRFAK